MLSVTRFRGSGARHDELTLQRSDGSATGAYVSIATGNEEEWRALRHRLRGAGGQIRAGSIHVSEFSQRIDGSRFQLGGLA